MTTSSTYHAGVDTPELRKARGAFFTPEPVARFMTEWAVRGPEDRVLEPSAGDAEFLVSAVERLRELGVERPRVHGVEIHRDSADEGRRRVEAVGGEPLITVGDFFMVPAAPRYDAVIGNPPYIRYQDFAGEAREKARAAARTAGVELSGLASSWAAFTVYSAKFLAPGGRLALVVPGELLSVNYAAPVRDFLVRSFAKVDIILFDRQVFNDAETDAVLLMASGFGAGGNADVTSVRMERFEDLAVLGGSIPTGDPVSTGRTVGDKWTVGRDGAAIVEILDEVVRDQAFGVLDSWGDTTLGAVTGNNAYFTLSSDEVALWGIPEKELVRLSPPGSRHLRGLRFTVEDWLSLGDAGRPIWLFRPGAEHSRAAKNYLAEGRSLGVPNGYKCRTRKIWYQTPLGKPADLLLTYMNADTPRLVRNEAHVQHLNSVHGVFLRDEFRTLGNDLLPLASLNSVTILHAELVGRAYGGGVLKLEPKEADRWLVPSGRLVAEKQAELHAIREQVEKALNSAGPVAAARLVDEVVLGGLLATEQIATVREAGRELAARRAARGKKS
ncbi:Eco57I restriction-modification methylase domain-containing protein [uncultured Corynebacterium sp.]|uniref:Eco57I restriction-modification methylase domain-containing protein n=1 Tax=uncultured Corynebacterium sp. TaxID=159447 RepID=UPI0025DA0A5A|nr:N-6 DNA methylase [uncultured Corynebacterium sp.]